METDDTQAPDDRDVNRLQGIPEIKVELRPAPDVPGQHLLFVGGQQISGFDDEATIDNDDAPNPVADWTPNCQGHPPRQDLIRFGTAFVEQFEGVLSEGQMMKLTGLDRVAVRGVEDLFDQAMSGLAEALRLAAPAPVTPAARTLSEHLAAHTASQSINVDRECLQDARVALTAIDDKMTRDELLDRINNLRRVLGGS